jgi:PIN domain nuclease of toxin-antitoxin system
MRLLLDTHAFLWAISDEPRLGPRSRDLITTEASSVLISHVSIWEIAIKHALAWVLMSRLYQPIASGCLLTMKN